MSTRSRKEDSGAGQTGGRAGGLSPEPVARRWFFVAGVGICSGAVQALTTVLKALPHDTGIAFVVAQHLQPADEGVQSKVLSSATEMPVDEIAGGTAVAPDHIYVMPPKTDMTILDGILRLTKPRKTAGGHLPIDHFFGSLAEDQKSRAIGISLCGTGVDGIQGLEAIKAEGGITFAQDEKSARHAGMPFTAATAQNADFVLPPEKIAAELIRIVRHPYMGRAQPDDVAESSGGGGKEYHDICLLLSSATGVDFLQYDAATVNRRIARRMVVQGIDSLGRYLQLLRKNPSELELLYQDTLVRAAGFFRDPNAFRILETRILPNIMGRESAGQSIRAWVPACSTGEEAYSVAMLLLEAAADQPGRVRMQVFGTDIDEPAIHKARRGIYPEASLTNVSQSRLTRFFVKVEGGFHVKRSLRDMCVFGRHDLTKDPPFSNLDLIICRNVLIYMGAPLQEKTIEGFHYALTQGGYLFLGQSDSLGTRAGLFRPEHRKYKIYSRKPVPPLHFYKAASPGELLSGEPARQPSAGATHQDLNAAKEAILALNEELQSRNEELEAVKEELKSSNKELTTLNEELQSRSGELSQLVALLKIESAGPGGEKAGHARDYAEAIVETIEEPLLILDGELRVLSANTGYYRAFRVSPEETLGRSIFELGNAQWNVPDLRRLLEQLLPQDNRIDDFEVGHEFPEIGVRRMLINARRIYREGVGTGTILLTIRDITEQVEARNALRASEARYRAIVEDQTELICRFLPDGTLTFVNDACCDHLGMSRDQLIGHSFFDRLVPEVDREVIRELLHSFTPGHPVRTLVRKMVEPGEPWREWVVRAFFNDQRQVTEFQAAGRDITELKHSEAALLEYQQELRALTARLIAAQEASSKHLARELHDVFSQQLAVIGMEITELEQVVPDSAEAIRNRCRQLAKRIGELSKDIHRMSRQLHPAILDDLGLAAALKNECLAFSDQHGVPVAFTVRNCQQQLPEDVTLCLYRVVQESLRNIGKHAAAKEVRVDLTCGRTEIALVIEDIGNGFEIEGVRGKGGLGLVSMDERVRLVDGTFSIQSEPGRGTRVEVRVPLRRRET